MQTFNKNTERKINRKRRLSEENTNIVQDRIWRHLKSNAISQRRLRKHVIMKKTIKKYPRRNPKNQGFSKINYDLF